MAESICTLEGVRHCYDDRVALVCPRLSIERGTIVGLVGPNGAGKTTLLKLIALLEQPTRGRVELFSGRTNSARRRVSLLLQDPYLLKRSVFDNVAYGLMVRKQTAGLTEAVHQALTWVGLDPADFARRDWRELSGGESQRAALAARLILKPELLLLDEPVSGIDPVSSGLIRSAALMARREWGATLVVASHDLVWLFDAADRIISLYKSRVVERGPVNFIEGDWGRIDDDRAARPLGEGWLVAPATVLDSGVGLIDPSAIRTITRSDQSPFGERFNRIPARISQMIHERSTGSILMTCQAGGQLFWVRRNRSTPDGAGLFPGQEILLSFPVEAVEALPRT